MPTYEYGCSACGRVVEVMHGVHGSGPERCEACGGALRKLISAPAIHFKGSGWAGKDARDSGRSRSASGGANESKTSPDAKKASGDETKSSPSATADTSAGTSAGSADAAPASSGTGKPA